MAMVSRQLARQELDLAAVDFDASVDKMADTLVREYADTPNDERESMIDSFLKSVEKQYVPIVDIIDENNKDDFADDGNLML